MRTLKTLFIAATFILCTAESSSQSLLIKGRAVNADGKKLHAEFILRNDSGEVISKTSSKVKYKLQLNREYVMEIAEKGCGTKTVRFTTFTEEFQTYEFDFTVTLQKHTHDVLALSENQNTVSVFYDKKKRNFNYSRF